MNFDFTFENFGKFGKINFLKIDPGKTGKCSLRKVSNINNNSQSLRCCKGTYIEPLVVVAKRNL